MPFSIKSHTFTSIEKLYALQNLRLGILPVVGLKIAVDDNGVILFTRRGEKRLYSKRAEKSEKKSDGKKKKLGKKIDIEDFDLIVIKKLTLRGSFGIANDAASTALSCAAFTLGAGMVYGYLPLSADRIDVDVLPAYGKNTLELELKLDLRFNILVIIFTLFKILFGKQVKEK